MSMLVNLFSSLREGIKKVTDRSVYDRGNPQSATKIVFYFKREKDAECSEMEKYAKIFCDIFASVSRYFHKILKFFL